MSARTLRTVTVPLTAAIVCAVIVTAAVEAEAVDPQDRPRRRVRAPLLI